MALSAAERQRRSREKKKAEIGEEACKQKERERKKASYKAIGLLGKSEQEERRQKGREKSQNHRARQMLAELGNNHLVVKLPCMTKTSQARRRRTSRAVSRAHRKIKDLEEKNKKLKTKMKTVMKRENRSKKKIEEMKATAKKKKQSPRTSARETLKSCKLSPKQCPVVFKQLVAYNALVTEVKESFEVVQKKQKTPIARILSGRITKKYRLTAKIAKDTGISRHRYTYLSTNLIYLQH